MTMASKAHAFFCFEVLVASFGNDTYPDLDTIVSDYESSQSTINERTKTTNHINLEQDENIKSKEGRDRNSSIPRLQAIQHEDQSTPSSLSNNSSTSQLSATTRLSSTESYPLFVTWNTLSRSGHKSLRGCIGTFEALPLEKGLTQYALTSAFEDTRFAPIPASLVPKLSCSLTLLADFEEANGPFEWTLGVHGIRISFTSQHRRYGATYLPDVAVEQGWTKEETLESLMRKAGWESSSTTARRSHQNPNPWEEVQNFKLVRYTGLKASATYDEWENWRTG